MKKNILFICAIGAALLSSCSSAPNEDLAKREIISKTPHCHRVIKARTGGINGMVVDYYVSVDSLGELHLFRDDNGSMVEVNEYE